MADTSAIQSIGENLGKSAANAWQQPLTTMQTVQSLINSQQYNKNLQQNLLNQQQELENAKLTHDTGTLALQANQIGHLGGIAVGLALGTPDEQMTPEFVRSHIGQLATQFPSMAGAIQQFASTVTDGDTPATLKQKLMTIGMQSVKPEIAQQMAGKTSTMQTTGPGGVPVQVGTVQPGMGMPNEGQVLPQGAGVPMSLSPGEGAEVIPIPNTTGGTDYYLKRQLAPNGQPLPGETPQRSGPAGGTGTGGGAAAVPPPQAGGPQQPQVAQNGLPAPMRSVSPLPGKQLASDSENYNTVLKNTAPVNQDISDLTEAYNLVKGLTTSGKGLDWVNLHRSEIVSWAKRFNIDPGPVNTEDAAYDLANKILTRVQMNAPGAGQSAIALETAGSASPNLGHMNHDAALSAMQQLIGQRRQYLAAAMDHPDKSGGGFTAAQSDYFNNTDRDGFAADLMTKQEVQDHLKMLGGENSPRGKAFASSVAKLQRLFHRDPASSLNVEGSQ